jgi:hypothetical protein
VRDEGGLKEAGKKKREKRKRAVRQHASARWTKFRDWKIEEQDPRKNLKNGTSWLKRGQGQPKTYVALLDGKNGRNIATIPNLEH